MTKTETRLNIIPAEQNGIVWQHIATNGIEHIITRRLLKKTFLTTGMLLYTELSRKMEFYIIGVACL